VNASGQKTWVRVELTTTSIPSTSIQTVSPMATRDPENPLWSNLGLTAFTVAVTSSGMPEAAPALPPSRNPQLRAHACFGAGFCRDGIPDRAEYAASRVPSAEHRIEQADIVAGRAAAGIVGRVGQHGHRIRFACGESAFSMLRNFAAAAHCVQRRSSVRFPRPRRAPVRDRCR
jgi:hypothetical protein